MPYSNHFNSELVVNQIISQNTAEALVEEDLKTNY